MPAPLPTRPPISFPVAARSSSTRATALATAVQASHLVSIRSASTPYIPPSPNTHVASATALSFITHQHATANPHLTSSQARRSRAALHGSNRTADPAANMIHLPDYVVCGVDHAIAQADKHMLHQDHMLTAQIDDPQSSSIEADKLPPARSSILHLSTASPARYAAIVAVLAELKQRLASPVAGRDDQQSLPSWTPQTVVDYDCSTAEGLWAAANVFNPATGPLDVAATEAEAEAQGQVPSAEAPSNQGVRNYYGFDRRSHLLKMGKRLVESVTRTPDHAAVEDEAQAKTPKRPETIQLDRQVFEAEESVEAEEDTHGEATPVFYDGPRPAISRISKTFLHVPIPTATGSNGSRTLALSAFALSHMTHDHSRSDAVQSMWDSGAEVLVLIDHATRRGFASIAAARAQLLQLGQDEQRDVEQQGQGGAHVVAPCPHDRPCPLLHPFSVSSAAQAASGSQASRKELQQICTFSSRLVTPSFLRKTRHSKKNEEDVEYSYVVVRRGQRPGLEAEARRRVALQQQQQQSEADPSSASVADAMPDPDYEAHLAKLVEQAERSKSGILDLLRSIKAAARERRTLEEIGSEAQLEGAPASLRDADGDAASADIDDAMAAEEEMMRLLPEAMRAEMAKAGIEEGDGEGTEGGVNVEQLLSQFTEAAKEEQIQQQQSSADFHRRSAIDATAMSEGEATTDALDTLTLSDALSRSAAASETSTSAQDRDWTETDLSMRLQSYTWPRLIRPPLKKGGHVTIDACCSSGNIERFTIAKSAGRQAYQDARKAQWGDLFPHRAKHGKSMIKILGPEAAAIIEARLEAARRGEEAEGEGEGERVVELKLNDKKVKMQRKKKEEGRRLKEAMMGRGDKEATAHKQRVPQSFPDEEAQDDDDDDEKLQGLFETDEEAEARLEAELDVSTYSDRSVRASMTVPPTSSHLSNQHHRLIGADTIAPTASQSRKTSQSQSAKWDETAQSPSSSSLKAGSIESQLRRRTQREWRMQQQQDGEGQEEDERRQGWKSTLSSEDPRLAVKQQRRKRNRASRTRSRGDFDDEIFR